jgi:tRNA A22 N-methylase
LQYHAYLCIYLIETNVLLSIDFIDIIVYLQVI